jgi:exodeoxyribonuclease VII small subunit
MSNSQNYAENYQKLEAIAMQLSRQDRVDIDQLLPMIDEAMASYAFCKSRIEQVETLLQSRLQMTPNPDKSISHE